MKWPNEFIQWSWKYNLFWKSESSKSFRKIGKNGIFFFWNFSPFFSKVYIMKIFWIIFFYGRKIFGLRFFIVAGRKKKAKSSIKKVKSFLRFCSFQHEVSDRNHLDPGFCHFVRDQWSPLVCQCWTSPKIVWVVPL